MSHWYYWYAIIIVTGIDTCAPCLEWHWYLYRLGTSSLAPVCDLDRRLLCIGTGASVACANKTNSTRTMKLAFSYYIIAPAALTDRRSIGTVVWCLRYARRQCACGSTARAEGVSSREEIGACEAWPPPHDIGSLRYVVNKS